MSAKARRILALLRDPRHRERITQSMNRDNTDDMGPLGGDRGLAVLNDMNELEGDHAKFVRSLGPRIDIL